MNRTCSKLVVAIALVTLSLGRAEAGAVYDLAGDFSIASNPNGVWTYGQYAGVVNPATFAAFTSSGDLSPSFPTLQYWDRTTPISDPNIIYNSGASDVNLANIDFRSHKVTFGPFLGPTVARFTAPSAGLYDLSTTFETVQSVNSPPTAYIFDNTTQLFQQDLTTVNPASFKTELTLAAGENVDFVVFGNNTNNKTTQVDATITAVPEPSTMVTAGTAAAFGLVCSLRRRKRAATA